MLAIKARPAEPLEKTIKYFKRKLVDDGLLEELQDRRYYKKPSTIKNEKLKELRRLNAKRRKKNRIYGR